METFDVKYNGKMGVLALNGRAVTLNVDGIIINSELLSVAMIGTERLKMVWEEDGRKTVTIRVISTPASRVYQKILNPTTQN